MSEGFRRRTHRHRRPGRDASHRVHLL